MSNTRALGSTKSWARRGSIGGAAAFALVVTGLSVQANAVGPAFDVYDEGDSPNPLNATEALVFSKGADLGWVVASPLSGIESLSYTVESSVSTTKPVQPTAWAPTFQLVTFVDRDGGSQKYTRLVWEPYMQDAGLGLDASHGEYTDLEDGVWWTSKIASGPGSQSDPQPLSFFGEGGGAGWANANVYAVAVHQGTTTEVTSVVSDITYNGNEIAIGNPDTTPFDESDIAAAVAEAVAPLNSEISGLEGELSDALADIDDLNGQLGDTQDALADKQNELAATQLELADAQGDLEDAEQDIADLLDEVDGLLTDIEDLQGQVDDLQDELDAAQADVDDLEGQLTTAQSNVTSTQSSLTTTQATLAATQAQLASTQAQLVDAQGALVAYKSNHHVLDNTYIGASRVALTSAPVVGKSVAVKLQGTIAKSATPVTYQWYVSGKPVPGATKATFKVPASAKGKTVAVTVKGSSKLVVFAVSSAKAVAK